MDHSFLQGVVLALHPLSLVSVDAYSVRDIRRSCFFRTPLTAEQARTIIVYYFFMRPILLALLPLLIAPVAALAQKEIPKASGHDQCPIGYVNTHGTTCVSPISYKVVPTNG